MVGRGGTGLVMGTKLMVKVEVIEDEREGSVGEGHDKGSEGDGERW